MAFKPSSWQKHPASYWFPAVLCGIVAVVMVPVSLAVPLCWIIVGSMLFWAICIIMSGRRAKWSLTDDRIVYRYSFLSSEENALFYQRIDQVSMHQSLLGRIFDYGTVVLTPKGKDGKFYIFHAAKPKRLKVHFHGIAAKNQKESPG